MRLLVRATCPVHLISAQTSLEGIKCTKAKECKVMSYCPNIYTVMYIKLAMKRKKSLNSKQLLALWRIKVSKNPGLMARGSTMKVHVTLTNKDQFRDHHDHPISFLTRFVKFRDQSKRVLKMLVNFTFQSFNSS